MGGRARRLGGRGQNQIREATMGTLRRDVLRWLGLGAAMTAAAPGGAWGDRIRILPGAQGGERAGTPGKTSPELAALLVSVRADQIQRHGVLSVLWLHAKAPAPGFEVTTLEEARAQSTLRIMEREQATVPELIVENQGASSVLLLAGEILLGGKQNRVLTEDVLLPPMSGPRELGVYCVEQGRWAGGRTTFESRGTFAAPALRSRLMAKAPQAQVWAEVDRYSRLAYAASPTQSYQQVYEQPEVRDHVKSVERAIDLKAASGAHGAAVFVAETLAGLDLFQDAGLFAREWPKLLSAYAVETYRGADQPGGDERRLRKALTELLRSASSVEGTLRTNAGVGQLFEFRAGKHRGASLTFKGSVVHAAIL